MHNTWNNSFVLFYYFVPENYTAEVCFIFILLRYVCHPLAPSVCHKQRERAIERERKRDRARGETSAMLSAIAEKEYEVKLKQLLIKYSLFRWANRMRMKNEKQKQANSNSFYTIMLYVQTVDLRERISAIDAIWELAIARWTLNLMRHLVGCRAHNFAKHWCCRGDHFLRFFSSSYCMIC